ncbi:ATP cone domain-containing protein [Mariniphaga anaerophila]|uniref:ATP cone domain-containing protein n=1 Tax=Mariniphaga anaerophila TaxID=1484053 RepID=A0A1M4WCL1_9BACT|nr:restriction endonuclease [Mariniphaga anaerophila]SHE78979.1 ATP cone domain-containing protein [Mariniphaga anaerophila]
MKNNHYIIIKKASGEKEAFDVEKLKGSLRRAGAEESIVHQVAGEIDSWIYDGITTQKIYSRAFGLLRKKKKQVASRYKLKKAIMELGPTGFPFEHLMGKILEKQGYSTEVGQIINGRCVSHEVDVVATRDKVQYFVECKYGQSPGKTISVQVPLYIRSRVDDIIAKRKESGEYEGFEFGGWVATNTRFTSDAIAYGTCCGLNLLSWDYPLGNGLKDIIDREKIYPITVLHYLTKAQKQALMEQGIVICRQILENPKVVDPFELTSRQHKNLMNELKNLL